MLVWSRLTRVKARTSGWVSAMEIMRAPRRPRWPMVPVVVEKRWMKETAPELVMAALRVGVPFGRRVEMSKPQPPPRL
jgi:hypothetical protein